MHSFGATHGLKHAKHFPFLIILLITLFGVSLSGMAYSKTSLAGNGGYIFNKDLDSSGGFFVCGVDDSLGKFG